MSLPAPATIPGLTIREFSDALAPAFHDINFQWLSSMYSLEPIDLEVLRNPRSSIIDAGGVILFVEAEGLGIVGTCALLRSGEGEFELTKMGVLEAQGAVRPASFCFGRRSSGQR